MDGTTDTQALTVQLGESLRTVVQPLSELVEKLDAAIAEREQELAQLRDLRRQATRVTNVADPTTKPGRKPGKVTGKATKETRGRAAKKERVLQLARAMPGEDISSDLWQSLNTNGLPAISRGMLYDLFRELRDDGVLRLDRTASGGQAIYRLVGES